MKLHTATYALGAFLAFGGSAFAQAKNQIDFSFDMVPSATPCGTPKGFVTITHDLGPTPQTGLVENMHVVATGLPANTDFDFFVIQVPNAPFGLAWYMGDMLTDSAGVAVGDFYGRFQIGTFVCGAGSGSGSGVFRLLAGDVEYQPVTDAGAALPSRTLVRLAYGCGEGWLPQ